MDQIDKIDGIRLGSQQSLTQPGSTAGNSQGLAPGQARSWFEAMAAAWGKALDNQAGQVTKLSDKLTAAGEDLPSVQVQLTAESLRLQYLSNSASTSVKAVAEALEALGRKQ